MEDLAERLQADAVDIVCASPYRRGWVRGLDMMITALTRRYAYDLAVVALYSGRAFLWGEAVTRLLSFLRCPVILVLHGGNLPEFARRFPGRVRDCLGRAAVVIAPSAFLLEKMRPYCRELFLLPNPLELGWYPFEMRDNLRPRLMWLRSLHRIYNPLLALKVVALIKEEFPEVSLTMVGRDKGDGSLSALQQAAEELGVDDRLRLIGGILKREVPEVMAWGDIFINTTNIDNTPVSVMEAMACGLCIVSTAVGGIPYLLEHEKDALLVPPDDAEAMAGAVRRLLTEKELAARLSLNARRKVENFDWGKILPQWKQVLKTASKRK